MQIDVELQGLFSYSLFPIIVLLLILFIPIIFFLYKKCFSKKKDNFKVNLIKDVNSIKYKYLNQLNELEKNLIDGNIDNRKAYQELSMLIRLFVYELTGMKLQTYSLKEIEKLNIPVLYELMYEYYNPEFSKVSKGNIKASIEKTKGVIEKWN